MSKIVDYIKKEHAEEHALLKETEEDAHTHTLWIRRMESQQDFLEKHVPDNAIRKKMLGHLQRLRQLIGTALETKDE